MTSAGFSSTSFCRRASRYARRAADLLRGERRRHLPVRADEVGQRLTQLRLADRRRWPLRRQHDQLAVVAAHHPLFGVVGRRRPAQPDAGDVFLLVDGQELREPRRPADHQRQHAGRQRIERAGVADPRDADRPPHPRHDVVRRGSGGFVDDQDAVHGRSAVGWSAGRCCDRVAPASAGVASGRRFRAMPGSDYDSVRPAMAAPAHPRQWPSSPCRGCRRGPGRRDRRR